MEDLISIIVPVYNVEKYLERCLDSLLQQTYENIEIILVDDGSTDQSGLICDNYAKKHSHIKVIHKENGGLSSARNTGLTIAQGNFVGFVDSDDWVTTDAYEFLYKLLTEADADLAISNFVRCHSEKEGEQKKSETEVNSAKVFSQSEYMEKFMKINTQSIEYYAWNKLYKKELIQNDPFPLGLTAEDVVGTFRYLLQAKKIVQSNHITYFYYINEQSITADFSVKKANDLIEVWDLVVLESKKDQKYYAWARLNRARIDFAILCHIALSNNYSNLITNDDFISALIINLKKNKSELLESNISLSRKLCIHSFLISYKTCSKIINIINGFLRR